MTLLISLQSFAQGVYNYNNPEVKNGFFESKEYEIVKVGVPVIASGLAFIPIKEEFQTMRHRYCNGVRVHVDDYLQYAPAALMVGLKFSGVESRSSWGRMLTSDALSVVIVSLATNGLKQAARVARPDSGAKNSFPSGHTATAFVTATMLHKEYGAKSPLYSIGGYSVATATGLLRVVNNRHWISDVMVGAGIGILSTELGYLFADMIFGDKHINKDMDRYSIPSWGTMKGRTTVGMQLSAVSTLRDMDRGVTIDIGSKIGVEGSYLIGEKLGIMASLALSNSAVKLDNKYINKELSVVSTKVGALYSQTLSNRWRALANAAVGLNSYNKLEVSNGLNINKGSHTAYGAGVAIEYLSSENWVMRAFCDYEDSKIHRTLAYGVAGSVIF